MGRHVFAYALIPHRGGWREAGVLAEAIHFNAPVRWTHGVAPIPLASVADGELVLDTIKRGERSDDLVLRLYEPFGGRGVARVRLGAPFSEARFANALEDELGEVTVEDGDLVLPYRPHEILTVLLR